MSRVRANKFTDRAGTGAPEFPYGLTGTATTAQGLTGTPDNQRQKHCCCWCYLQWHFKL